MSPRRVLDALDVLFVLGARVERDEWCARFKPDLAEESARRAWVRFKVPLLRSGLPVRAEATPGGPDVLVFDRGARAALEALLPAVQDQAAA